jgi:toxin ParE1/3/4
VKERSVVLAPEAVEDLNELYDWVAAQASPDVAMGYLKRVEAFCQRLSLGSERGHLRGDIRPGLRITGFEHRLTIAFTVEEETVTVLRVFTAGRNWETSF